MTEQKLDFVSFETHGDSFHALLFMDGIIETNHDPEIQLKKASLLYVEHIRRMRGIMSEINMIRKTGGLTPARKVWRLGDTIYRLIQQLIQLSLQIDGLYEHLVRDLDVKRKWLEKVVILRRYIPKEKLIPKSSNWGQFEKGTRKAAERLLHKANESKKK